MTDLHMATADKPQTLTYRPCAHMFRRHTESGGCVAAYGCYWTQPSCELSGLLTVCTSVDVWEKFIGQHMLGKHMCWQVPGMHVSDICRLRGYFVYVFTGRVCESELCGSNPRWAAALICIQPRGTSACLADWGSEMEGEVRKRDKDGELEIKHFSHLVNSLLMSLIPLSRSLPLSHNIHHYSIAVFFFLSTPTPKKWKCPHKHLLNVP